MDAKLEQLRSEVGDKINDLIRDELLPWLRQKQDEYDVPSGVLMVTAAKQLISHGTASLEVACGSAGLVDSVRKFIVERLREEAKE